MYTYDKPDNLVELLQVSVARHEGNPLFGTKQADGEYRWITYREVGERIDALRAGLATLGVGPGDTVGIIAANCTEWAICAFAAFGRRARFIPMYPKELSKTWQYIIQNGAIKVLFVADGPLRDMVEPLRQALPGLEKIIVIDGRGPDSMAALEAMGRNAPVAAMRPTPADIAVLIYTSGTTGNPKGVLLSHGNFTSNVLAGLKMFPALNAASRALSILPWAHSYAQTAELYTFIHLGASIGLAQDVTTIAEDMAKVAPTFLFAVPRVFNKIYAGLWHKIHAVGGVARKIFHMGLAAAERRRAQAALGNATLWPALQHKLADAVVYRKIRRRFGGRLEGALTASAMMNPEVARFFADIGIPVFDCYGLTETSPAVTMNCFLANKPGSVGRPIDKVKVVIDRIACSDGSPEGEVVVYGPNVMQGYHNDPSATAAVLTPDGGLRTGDQGRLDEEGFLFITGRIKEQYKLENGKYVFPATLEEEIRLAPWVENAMVFGDGRAYNICLVVPDFVALSSWAKSQGLPTVPGDLTRNPAVQEMIAASIQEHLKGKFGGYEVPKKFVLLEEGFNVENGLLTQTLKLKRRKVIEQYADRIDGAYATAGSAEG